MKRLKVGRFGQRSRGGLTPSDTNSVPPKSNGHGSQKPNRDATVTNSDRFGRNWH